MSCNKPGEQADSSIAGGPCLPLAAHLLEMWHTRAREETLPERPLAFKHPRLMVTSANRGPQANAIWDRAQRMTERTPTESADTEWQAPPRSQRPQGLPDPPAWPHSNWVAGLPRRFWRRTQLIYKSTLSYPLDLRKPPKTKRRPAVRTQVVSPQRLHRIVKGNLLALTALLRFAL